MTEVKMELVGSAPPVPTQGAMSGYAMMPCAPGQGFDRAGMEPAQQTTDRGGAPTGGMDAGPMRGEMSKSAGGVSAMMPTMTAADMMLPRVASPPVDDTDPRIHKELNEIIGKKQLELHVQVPPLTKGPLVPSPHNMNGVKPGTPQAGGMTKAAVGSRSGGSTPQGRTGTRAAGTRANLSKTIEDACQAAAIEDGVLAGSRSDPPAKASKAKNGLRRGKWTPEEESYANRLIVEFKAGLLPLTDGTTLRTFLSKLLNCDPMRISKKFVGQNCIGKQVFRRRQVDMDRLTNEDIERSRQELADLERKFLERVAQTNRCKNSSGISKLTGGKDMGMGQVAPEVNRRTQEYASVGGRNVQNPIIPPWMLPPVSGGAGGSAAGNGASANTSGSNTPVPPSTVPPLPGPPNGGMMGWDANGRQPAQGGGRGQQGMAQGQGGMRRSGSDSGSMTAGSTPSLSPTGPGPSGGVPPAMPRTDSTDSLFQQVAENITPLSDYPRNSSIGDLASLGIFAGSPFQSTENLLALANASNTPVSPMNGLQGSASGASCSTSGSTNGQPPPSFAPAGPQAVQQRSASGGEWGGEFAASGHPQQPQQQMPYFDGSTATGPPPPVPHQDEAMAPRGPSPFQRPAEGAMTQQQQQQMQQQQMQQQQMQQQEQRTMPRVESSTGLTSLRVQGGMPRHGSVEDFLSLVACGDIPAPETNILSTSVFSGHAHQRPGAQQQAAMLAQQQQQQQRGITAAAGGQGPTGGAVPYSNFPPPAVVSFSGIGKSAGVPVGFAPQVPMEIVQQGVGKRPRGPVTQSAAHGVGGVTLQADGAVESGVRLKQPKIEGHMY